MVYQSFFFFFFVAEHDDQTTEDFSNKTKMVVLHLRATLKPFSCLHDE